MSFNKFQGQGLSWSNALVLVGGWFERNIGLNTIELYWSGKGYRGGSESFGEIIGAGR